MGARDVDLCQEYLNYIATMGKSVAAEVVPTLTDDQAVMIGEAIAVRLSADQGGRPQPYIPKGRFFQAKRTEERVMDALAEARRAREPQPYVHVAGQLKLSLGYVYEVEKRVIEAERARRQGTLEL